MKSGSAFGRSRTLHRRWWIGWPEGSAVDERTLRVLEFAKVTERLASYAVTVRGRELAETLEPSADPDDVTRRLAVNTEGTGCLCSPKRRPRCRRLRGWRRPCGGRSLTMARSSTARALT